MSNVPGPGAAAGLPLAQRGRARGRMPRPLRHLTFTLGLAITALLLLTAAVSLVYTPRDPLELSRAARMREPPPPPPRPPRDVHGGEARGPLGVASAGHRPVRPGSPLPHHGRLGDLDPRRRHRRGHRDGAGSVSRHALRLLRALGGGSR